MQNQAPASPPDCRYIGIDIGGTKVHAIAADASLRPIADTTEPTDADVISQVLRLCGELGHGKVAGIGIGVPGSVHPSTGVISKVPNVVALEGVDLAYQLGSSLGVPVVVENDLVAAARAEARPGGDPDEVVAVIAAGTGVGMGIARGADVFRGARGAAGEIADIPLSGQTVLEDHVSATGLVTAFQMAGGSTSHTVPEVLAMASGGDATAGLAVASYVSNLAQAIVTVVAVLDPTRIVLTGGLGSHPVVFAALTQMLDADLRALVGPSEFGPDSPVRGAVLLAHDAARRSTSPVTRGRSRHEPGLEAEYEASRAHERA